MPKKPTAKKKPAKKKAAKPELLSGGNPQIAKGDGAAPVRAYITAMPGWKKRVGKALDELIVDPWDNAYVYEPPGEGKELVLYSLGRDGAPGGVGEGGQRPVELLHG